jgi:hypothetical protein
LLRVWRYSENRDFRPRPADSAQKNNTPYQRLRDKIRYLADQWKINGIFSPINEFRGANNRITMEVRYRYDNSNFEIASEKMTPYPCSSATRLYRHGRPPRRGAFSPRASSVGIHVFSMGSKTWIRGPSPRMTTFNCSLQDAARLLRAGWVRVDASDLAGRGSSG